MNTIDPVDLLAPQNITSYLGSDTTILVTRNDEEIKLTIRKAYSHWTDSPIKVDSGYSRSGSDYTTRVPENDIKLYVEKKGIPMDFRFFHKDRCTPWDLSIPTYTKSFDGNMVIPIRITKIIQSGINLLFNFKAEHHCLQCSLNQQILTDSGWIYVGDIKPDTKVMILDDPDHVVYTQIKSITGFSNEKPTFGLEFDNPLESYVANGFIVRPSILASDFDKERWNNNLCKHCGPWNK